MEWRLEPAVGGGIPDESGILSCCNIVNAASQDEVLNDSSLQAEECSHIGKQQNHSSRTVDTNFEGCAVVEGILEHLDSYSQLAQWTITVLSRPDSALAEWILSIR